jgi:hypothetical protein
MDARASRIAIRSRPTTGSTLPNCLLLDKRDLSADLAAARVGVHAIVVAQRAILRDWASSSARCRSRPGRPISRLRRLPSAAIGDRGFRFQTAHAARCVRNPATLEAGSHDGRSPDGFDLGKVYIARYFPESSKTEALAKLEATVPIIAYPQPWRDYGSLDIQGDVLIGNVMRAPIRL